MMNKSEVDILLEFLGEYLDGLEDVDKSEAIQAGISALIINYIFTREDMQEEIESQYGARISANRLIGMADGRLIFIHPAILVGG